MIHGLIDHLDLNQLSAVCLCRVDQEQTSCFPYTELKFSAWKSASTSKTFLFPWSPWDSAGEGRPALHSLIDLDRLTKKRNFLSDTLAVSPSARSEQWNEKRQAKNLEGF